MEDYAESDEEEEEEDVEDDEDIAKRLQRKRDKYEAEQELIEGVAIDEPDEHLDFNLDEELNALTKYTQLIQQEEESNSRANK